MYKVIKNKRCPVTLQVTKQVQKNSFISYILPDQVWWCNIKRLLCYFKNCICKFMHANSLHHKLFHFHLPFCIWKVWKGKEKITKVWISRERKELFWLNKFYHRYWVKNFAKLLRTFFLRKTGPLLLSYI